MYRTVMIDDFKGLLKPVLQMQQVIPSKHTFYLALGGLQSVMALCLIIVSLCLHIHRFVHINADEVPE